MVLVVPGNGGGIQVEVRRDSKTVVDWVSGKAKQTSVFWPLGDIQCQLRKWWSNAANTR